MWTRVPCRPVWQMIFGDFFLYRGHLACQNSCLAIVLRRNTPRSNINSNRKLRCHVQTLLGKSSRNVSVPGSLPGHASSKTLNISERWECRKTSTVSYPQCALNVCRQSEMRPESTRSRVFLGASNDDLLRTSRDEFMSPQEGSQARFEWKAKTASRSAVNGSVTRRNVWKPQENARWL